MSFSPNRDDSNNRMECIMRKSIEARELNNERRASERERNSARSNARYIKRAGFYVANAAFNVTIEAGI